MATNEIEGYVVKNQKYKEKDSIISIFTSSGIKTIYGNSYRSPKSKYHVLNNLFIKVKIYGKSKKFFQVMDYDVIEYFLEKYDYEILITLYKIIDLLIKTNSNGKFTYNIFEYILKNINYSNQDIYLYKIIVEVLKENNIFINFKTCNKCGKNKNFKTLSIFDGGLVCSECYYNQEIKTIVEIKKLNLIFNGNIQEIESIKTIDFQMKNEINYLLNESLGVYLKESA